MKDTSNPSIGEIKKWAYQEKKKEPAQDWDLVITSMGNGDLLLSLAADPECPKKAYFLQCLYLLVGDGVSKHRDGDRGKLEALLANAESSHESHIINWVARSRSILFDMRKFDYAEWLGGGWARKDLGNTP